MIQFLNKNKAFTLIELLVVISIIGVLSSIVLVSFSGSRDRAKLATAQQFDAQVSHALGAYAVGIWRFEEGSGIDIYDESGFGNDGTFSGNPTPVFPDGVYSGTKALQFDGVNDYVNCGDGASLNFGTSTWTVEAWVNPSDINNVAAIAAKGIYSGANDWLLYFYSNQLRLCRDGDYTSCATDASDLLNTWHHVVVLRDDNDDGVIFIDGEEKERETDFWQGYTITNNKMVTIGARENGTSAFLNGAIDNVAIYNEALSSAQIQQHFAAGATAHGIAINDK